MSNKPPKTKFTKTTEKQTLLMISWLEIPANFKLVTGSGGGGPVIAGTKLKKVDGFKGLANYIKNHDGAVWTEKSTTKRYEAMIKKFKSTNAMRDDNQLK